MSDQSKLKKYLGLSLMRRLAIKILAKILSAFETAFASEADLHYCYRLLLNREPEKKGWKDWLRQIKQGRSKEYVVNSFITSQEVINKQISESMTRVELDGFEIYVDPRDLDIGNIIIQEKTYEPHVTSVVREILKDSHTFLDIGANIGWFTIIAATIAGKNGRVIAVEPNYKNLQLLYHSIHANHFSNVSVFPYAASDSTTLLQLVSGVSNGVVRPVPEDKAPCEYIQAMRIDDIVRDEKRIDLIKIDIEGYEPIALKGMAELIKKHTPVIVSEFNPIDLKESSNTEPEDYLRALKKLGYSLSIIERSGNMLPMNDESKIMEYWRSFNRALDDSERSLDLEHSDRPIDIIARPE